MFVLLLLFLDSFNIVDRKKWFPQICQNTFQYVPTEDIATQCFLSFTNSKSIFSTMITVKYISKLCYNYQRE